MDGIHDMGGTQGFGHVQKLTADPPRVVSAKGLVGAGDLRARQAVLAARPAGHDHDQAGSHGHEH